MAKAKAKNNSNSSKPLKKPGWSPQQIEKWAVARIRGEDATKEEPKPDFGTAIAQGVQQLTDVKTFRDLLQAQTDVAGGSGSGDTEHVVNVFKSVIEEVRGQNQLLAQRVEEERQSRRELEAKIMELQGKNSEGELDFQKTLLTMLVNMVQSQNNKPSVDQALMERLTKLEEKIDRASKPTQKEEDELTKEIKAVQAEVFRQQAAQMFAPQQQPDPVSQIEGLLQESDRLKQLFGSEQNSNKLDLELKKLQMDDQFRREEAREKREVERERNQVLQQLAGAFQEFIPVAAQAMTKKGQNNNQPANVADDIATCPNCGKQYQFETLDDLPDACENCDTPFFDDTDDNVASIGAK